MLFLFVCFFFYFLFPERLVDFSTVSESIIELLAIKERAAT